MPFTKDQKELIVNLYTKEGLTLREISKRLNSHHQLIGNVIRGNDLPVRQERGKRTHFFNQRVFSEINSSDKAYFFGFLLADGAVDEKRGKLLVEVQKKDVEVLEGLKRLLGSDHLIKDMGDQRNSYRLSVQSRKMVSDLAERGCVQNKHDKIVFPEWLDKTLYSSFLLGYLDGDGSVFMRSRKDRPSPYLEVSIAGTGEFLTGVKKVLEEVLGEPISIKICRVSSKTETRVLRIRRKTHVLKILEFLYRSESPRLERKWRTARQILAT